MKKKLVACTVLCALMTSTVGVYGADSNCATNVNSDSLGNYGEVISVRADDVEKNTGVKKTKEYKLSKSEKKVLEEAKKSNNGKEAAEKINKLHGKAFEEAVDEILDEYYEVDGTSDSKLDDFVENISDEASEQLSDYEAAAAERSKEAELDYVTKNVIVEFVGTLSDESIMEILNDYADGGEIITGKYEIDENLPDEKKEQLKQYYENLDTKIVSVNLKKNQTTEEAMELFESMNCVKNSEKNDKQETCSGEISNDTYVDKQWYLNRIGVSNAWNVLKNANKCQKVKIAVIDTGADINHNDLRGRFDTTRSIEILDGKKTLFSNLDKTYSGNHGTRVTSIIGAKTNNNRGIAGVCGQDYSNGYSCEILEIKAGKTNEWELEKGYFNIKDEIDSLEYAISKGVDVINMSIAGTTYNSSYQQQVNNCRSNGILVVAAAGNRGVSTSTYPADYDHVTSVIALDKSNNRWESSNYGSTKDISAPGVGIYACIPGNEYDGQEQYSKGTSFAAPMVTATAAMIKSIAPKLTPAEIETIIKSTAKDVGAEGKDNYTSYGLLDTSLAVQRAIYRSYYDIKPVITSISSPEKSCVNVSWNSVANEEEMLIYRSTEKDGTYTRVGKVTENASGKYTFTDTGLTSGKVYYYKIRCRSAYGDTYQYGTYSNIISAKVS